MLKCEDRPLYRPLYLYVEEPGVDTDEVALGIVIKFDSQVKLVGIDIDPAKNVIDLTTLDTASIPLKAKSAQKNNYLFFIESILSKSFFLTGLAGYIYLIQIMNLLNY